MRILLRVLRLSWILPATLALSQRPVRRSYTTHDYYVLEHDPKLGISVNDCAAALGAEIVEPAGELEDHWLLRAEKSTGVTAWSMQGDRVLNTFAKLRATGNAGNLRRRTSRDTAKDLASSIRYLAVQKPHQRVKRHVIPSRRAPPPSIVHGGQTLSKEIAKRLGIADPLFSDQWHLVNEDYPEHMVNATPVWEMGITGEGIISALVDDGLDYESEDLADNFDAAGSHDFNDHVDLPKPMLSDDNHGTRCAGQIAAVKNGACGVGVAYNSKIAGIRILSGPISDVDEAAALNYGYQNTSIYSCSWGPSDDGQSMAAPSYLIQKAMLNGVQNGRGGKGSVFVFASGNGAAAGDQCNFDGYTNSIYSVTVAALDYQGMHPLYSESCAANMVVTYSSGSNRDRGIVTTDIGRNKCTHNHGGTSAAAPNAVGIFALALSTRPELTWRDIQHLCIQTARVINPEDPDWEKTATGRLYSYKYGFGKLDAYDYVTAAQKWELVKPQTWVEMPTMQISEGVMNAESQMRGGELIPSSGIDSFMVVTPQILEDNNFETLEHITVTVWISHSVRGDVEVELISPSGVRSVLAGRRPADRHTTGFPGWKFMTVKHWGENPIGEWTIRVSDQAREGSTGHFLGWSMSLWGSTIDATKARPYVLPWTEEASFPPPDPTHTTTPTITQALTTTSYLKPTVISTSVDLSDEVSTTAQPGNLDDLASSESTGPSQTSPVKSDTNEWLFDGIDYVSERSWTFGAVGIFFMIFVVGSMVVIWKRYVARRRTSQYAVIPDIEGVRMSSMDGGNQVGLLSRSEETGGDYSDDDSEESRLRGGARHVALNGVGFHSGFLEDDDDHDPLSSQDPAPIYINVLDERGREQVNIARHDD